MRAIAKRARTVVLAVVLGAGAALTSTAASQAGSVNVNDGYALHGYDPVAYFTKGEPTPGSDKFTADYEGITYRFASAENLDRFATEPAKYVPQYGGYCAFGTAMGRKFDGDPHAWSIVDGKLYLNLNKTVQQRWKEDPEGFIRGANHNWPIIAELPDSKLESDPPSGLSQGAQ